MAKIYVLNDYRKKPATDTRGSRYTVEQMRAYAKDRDCVYHRPGGSSQIDLWYQGKQYCIRQDDSQCSQMRVHIAGIKTRMWWYDSRVHNCPDPKLADAIHATCESYWAVRDCRKDKVYLMCDIWPYAATRLRKTEEL